MQRLSVLLLLLLLWTGMLSGQQPGSPDMSPGGDTALRFTVDEASDYVRRITSSQSMWYQSQEGLRSDLMRLLYQTEEPYDSVENRLSGIDLTTIPVRLVRYFVRDSTDIRWLNDSTFIIDSIGWNTGLMLRKETRAVRPVDFSGLVFDETAEAGAGDTILNSTDTVVVTVIDTAAVVSLGVHMFGYTGQKIDPPLNLRSGQSAALSENLGFLVITDTIFRWEPALPSPFRYLQGAHQLDSLQAAFRTLLDSNRQRDSTLLLISDVNGTVTPFWLSQGNNDTYRFWVKNAKNDSITIWLGNPAPMSLSLMMEDDIDVNRMKIAEIDHLPRELEEVNHSLMEMTKLDANPIYWDYDLSSAFTLNQTYLSNWTKGGESSLSSLLDIIGEATYNNKQTNTQWINNGRINIGTQFTQEKGFRKNNDLLEFTSKLNKYAYGKVSLSASLYMKSQVARGYNYPNDSVIVSKFLNPGSLTLGLGAEFKPWENTTINVAPISYKNTFVLDTALIDQTKHGISSSRRAKQEMGLQVVFFNKFSPMEDLTMMNRVRLFSNYLYRPQNIDVDWELLADWQINWFFTIRLNLHLIYDDDVRFTVYDQEGNPILGPDGSQKKVAKAQFKEFMGLSLQFNF